ncbi:hypothetical protein Theco_3985 (plasmid) [Thermobacillus composti KWC4]|jgi:hypothetical protein|uniref:Uncharacterized protein n=1 Tax=Thermobacillus composti (strain DSM 18247 / JCM 13945 / KWC4) TaxID=717605 RepID=L0EJX5_THECK|nr:hypothetical protein [Thermobacillus composti]AGA59989.1 hypothetical protein Theco_3985 [Thermobacillus composti KWC4]
MRLIYEGWNYEVIGLYDGVPVVYSIDGEYAFRLPREKLDAALRSGKATRLSS